MSRDAAHVTKSQVHSSISSRPLHKDVHAELSQAGFSGFGFVLWVECVGLVLRRGGSEIPVLRVYEVLSTVQEQVMYWCFNLRLRVKDMRTIVNGHTRRYSQLVLASEASMIASSNSMIFHRRVV